MLTELELRGCDLRDIPDDALYGVAPHLALLDLANNGLQEIPTRALAPLKKLRFESVWDSSFRVREMSADGKMHKESRMRSSFGI